MKNYKCALCGEVFSLEDGNYDFVSCPFCEKGKAQLIKGGKPKINRHPLFWPVWIVAFCNIFFFLVVLFHIVLAVVFWGAVVSAFAGVK